ncbi:MAG TPA: PPOX class F420-dependent oxidoreductase [Acidimicrobiia bacterium]|nr:PPOX class F420-dependent oxidoreductase [Acidimicrobiia bacterium]
MDLDRAVAFAADSHRGVVLTIGADGRPHASNIGYAILDGAAHISVTDDRVKTANVRRDNRASLHVASPDFWSWVVLEGEGRLTSVTVDPDDDAAVMLRRVYESISGPHPDWDEFNQAMIADRRLVLSVVPARAYGQVR